jgi:hypothetical protein
VKIILHLINKRHLLAAGLWLAAITCAQAITLGPNTRSATLGQPLDLSVQAMLEAGDDPGSLCLEADVFYADRQLAKSLIAVTAEKPVSAQQFLVHIRSATPVEGPVVTLQLRAGCIRKTARRYVVLAMAPRVANGNLGLTAAAAGADPASSAQHSLPNAAKVQALEAELRQLREEMLKSRAQLEEEKIQLEKAQGGRYGKALAWALGVAGLLLLALVALFLPARQRAGLPAAPEQRLRSGATGYGAAAGPSAAAAVSTAPDTELDRGVSVSLLHDLKRHRPRSSRPPLESVPPLAHRDRARFSVSVPFVHRNVKVPELFDLQQQVEFFSSLGQQDKAIVLLRKHLVNNVKTSALVYLDLLDLYRQTGNKEDYEVLRADFNRVFNAQIAPFDGGTATGSGAAAYEAVLARIQTAWPSRAVFDIIDEAVFREPGSAAELLELEAYRELLLLYAVGREIIDLEASPAASSAESPRTDMAMQPPSSPRLGLDIDLSELSGETGGKRAAASPAPGAGRRPQRQNPAEPTGFDSLVDFDDYDTGFRPG